MRVEQSGAGMIQVQKLQKTFVKDGQRIEAIKGLDFEIAEGGSLAIVGVSGAGKSTLIHLLMRFSDPEEGRILLDGRDLREYQLGNLRRHIGLVSQTVLLFDASVGENIAWGRPGAGAQFRLTLPRSQGAVLDHSPLPLVPRPQIVAGQENLTAAAALASDDDQEQP